MLGIKIPRCNPVFAFPCYVETYNFIEDILPEYTWRVSDAYIIYIYLYIVWCAVVCIYSSYCKCTGCA